MQQPLAHPPNTPCIQAAELAATGIPGECAAQRGDALINEGHPPTRFFERDRLRMLRNFQERI